MKRVLVPARLRQAVRSWFDSRYISVAEHRQDIRDALWEVQTLRREMATLQAEVERLRTDVRNLRGELKKRPAPPAGSSDTQRTARDAHRLARETAQALDGLLQNEVLIWQAIDELKTRLPASQEEQRPCA
jgi:predicted  nucleic acid-binding Zn-ribbon protein